MLHRMQQLAAALLCLALLISFTLPVYATEAGEGTPDTVAVTLTLPDSSVSVSVQNAAGAVIEPVSGSQVYRLTPGERYSYTATKDQWFHTTASFTAAEGLTVTVAAPETADALTAFGAYSARNASNAYAFSPAFSAAQHSYTVTVPDANSTFYMKATARSAEYQVHALYLMQTTSADNNGEAAEKVIDVPVESSEYAVSCGQCVAPGGYSNTVTLRLSKTADEITYYQDYSLLLARRQSFKTLRLSGETGALSLLDAEGNPVPYDRTRTDYYVKVARSTASLTLDVGFRSMPTEGSPNTGGYSLLIGGARYEIPEGIPLTLDPAKNTETFELQVCHTDAHAIPTTYIIHLEKIEPARITFESDPPDAIIYVENALTGRRAEQEADGSFLLMPGERYAYCVTRSGYVGMRAAHYIAPAQDGTVRVRLNRASENTALQSLEAEWPSFRADEYNNGAVDAPIPTRADDAVLYWATRLGSGYDSDACGCPILVDGCLYIYAGQMLYKLDKTSGAVLASGKMDHASNHSVNPPVYAEGMIFVGLSGGCVQAFNAVTLEPLWIYRDTLGGQPNCPITYHNGYLYTGFWNSERGEAAFVCLSATDELPENTDEEKCASWRYVSAGGFYGAGAYVSDGFLLVGTDDGGESGGYAALLSFDPLSGRTLDKAVLPHTGDIRSAVTFAPDGEGVASGNAYFTSKGGYFYAQRVNADGTFPENMLRELRLTNYADDPSGPAMSTCTPTICNGRAYIGVSGTLQFGAYSGHNITVIDLETMSVAYTVRTRGYPQASGILTTAYDEGDGTVYVYFFDNFIPGKLRVLSDRPGQTAPEVVTQEVFTSNGQSTVYDTAPVLFTPDGAQANYAVCSPVADRDGTLYFKNDSGYLMALGSAIERLEITRAPEKTVYHVGEVFQKDGLRVTAVCANGVRRDVTEYISCSQMPLTQDDAQFQISFRNVMYHDSNGVAGTQYHAPTGIVELSVRNHVFGEWRSDGEQSHSRVCACGKTEQEAHAWDSGVVTRAADFRSEGIRTFTCTVCGAQKSEKIPATAVSETQFVDISRSAWYYDAVCYCETAKLFNGTDATHFSPEDTMTRAMLVTVLYRLENSPAVTANSQFSDVQNGRWYTAAIVWASENGIVTGVGGGKFEPDAEVTREQMATILYRYAKNYKHNDVSATADLSVFPDSGSVSGWAQEAMAWANASGLVHGTAEGSAILLNPQGKATRAQVAAIMMRFCRL